MKKKHFLFTLTLAILTLFTVNVSGQAKADTTKAEKIFINKKGEIHDYGWNKIGFINKDNIVKNNQGKTIYFIDDNGNVIDAKGKNLGKAQKNGNYYNVNGANIITVRELDAEKCEILDPKGHSMGTVHKNYKLHACAAHCFWLQKKNEEAKKK
jgi:hypothetical protein